MLDTATAPSGLYYLRARYMDPELGRFISMDPKMGSIDAPQTINRYVYCINSPLRFTDPSGEGWWSDNWKTIAVIAVVVIAVTACVLTAGAAAPFAITAVQMMMVGAAAGAATGAGVNAICYLASTPKSEWTGRGLAGAWIGGAISGAAIGAAIASPYGWAATAGIGAAGGMAGYAAGNAIAGKPITAAGLALSGVMGAIGGAGGKYIAKSLQSMYEAGLLRSLARFADTGIWDNSCPLVPGMATLRSGFLPLESDWSSVVVGSLAWSSWSAGQTAVKALFKRLGLL